MQRKTRFVPVQYSFARHLETVGSAPRGVPVETFFYRLVADQDLSWYNKRRVVVPNGKGNDHEFRNSDIIAIGVQVIYTVIEAPRIS
jgi:hypothetical protein